MQREQNVMFAVPTYSMAPAMEFSACLARTFYLLSEARIGNIVRFRPGLCFIDVARNFLLTEFLEDHKDATDLFFIDDDIGWPGEKVLEFLKRPEPVVAGVYPKRQDSVEFPAILALDDAQQLVRRGDLYRALMVPGGFMRLKRDAVEKLAAKARKFLYPDVGSPKGAREIYNVFEARPKWDTDDMKEVGYFWGEDQFLGQKWIDLGGDIWVDPNIEFTHRGTKKWPGTFAASVKAYEQQASAAAEKPVAQAVREILNKEAA